MSRVSVQQLLRPTDTCLFMIRGKLLGFNSNEERIIAIVKHEGTAEHALFVFQVDHLGSLSINMLLPIYGMFTSVFRSSTPAGCQVEINIHGETYVFLLPYDTHTALFFSQLTLAKDKYLSSIKAGVSPVEFQWLDGYQMCRTGWDRFSKPNTTNTPGGGGAVGGANTQEIQSGFPDNWPWSHIITPRPDGRTDLAMCESFDGRGQVSSIDEFDPLRNNTPARSPPPFVVTMETSSPQSKSRLPYDPPAHQRTNPRGPSLLIPFDKPVRPCLSETNISQLQLEQRLATPPGPSPLTSALSQETLDDCVIRRRSIKESTPSPGNLTPRFPRERPQGFHLMPSPSSEITNPFSKEGVVQDEEEVWRRKEAENEANFFLVNSFSELEMTPTANERKDSSSSIKRTASLDVLDERKPTDSFEVLDYKQRRMRKGSSVTSSTANSVGGGVETRPLPVDTSASVPQTLSHKSPHHISAPAVTSHSTSSGAQAKSNKFHGKKSKPSVTPPVEGGAGSKWVSRYHPGVLLLKGSMRDCLIQRELHEREKDFCTRESLTLFCGTWNVNGQYPIQRVDKWLVYQETIPDIFAIGFQELDLSPEALLRNETSREEPWIDLVESSLKMAGKFKKISVVRLVGILLCVYVREQLVPHVSSVDYNYIPCGLVGGHFGNKGGVAIRFNIYHSSICIVNSHLAAHIDEVEKRNQNYHDIYDKINFFKDSELSYRIMDHNFIIWMGDLNYRIQTSIDISTEIIKALADLYQFNKLLQHDQLQQQQRKGEAFTHFKEPPIDFKPTYKFDPSTNSWDSSEKNRAPAWCDRILYYSDDMSHIKNLSYSSHPEMIISDHKPVSSTFELQVKVVVPDREKQTIDDISFKLDKLYNETLPQVQLNTFEFKFQKVKFMVERTQVLKVRNIGHRPVQLGFKPTPDKQDRICKPWLTIRPDKALILTSEEVSIKLTVYIDSDHVTSFHKGRDTLDDILVLSLEGGKDIFVSITGDLLSTCFGSSLETLIHVHTYVREVPTAQLVDLTMSSSWEEYDSHALTVHKTPPPLDIPKELYRLVQYLLAHGVNASGLFTDGGLASERERIRDTLDTGGEELVGSVYSAAAVLLTFLRSLEDPVVPRSLHQRCMDASNNPTLCKQVLLQMVEVHRRCFVFIVTFLKNLLEHSQENKMDAKVLASIFGEVLLNSTREEKQSRNKKTSSQINKKKMTFLYQFLANDLTVHYK